MTRLRVLLVSRNLPPLVGGMERLTHHLYQGLRQAADVGVAGPRGCRAFLDPNTPCREFPFAPAAVFLAASAVQAWRLARQTRPDWVLCGSGTAALAGTVATSASGARMATFLHGLDLIAEHPLYKTFFLPAIRRSDVVLVNSRYTAALAERTGIQAGKIHVVHPGVSLPDLAERPVAREAFRRRYGLGDRPVLLIAGRLTARKGIAEFIRESLPTLLSQRPDVMLVIIGREANQAFKHRQGVAEAIERTVGATGTRRNVLMLGGVDNGDLSQAYFGADVLVFPVLDLPGDVEGFGMVAIEAAAHGLPTVAFAVGGVPDAVAEEETGWLMAAGDYDGMTRTLVDYLAGEFGTQEVVAACRAHATRFQWTAFSARVLNALRLSVDKR